MAANRRSASHGAVLAMYSPAMSVETTTEPSTATAAPTIPVRTTNRNSSSSPEVSSAVENIRRIQPPARPISVDSTTSWPKTRMVWDVSAWPELARTNGKDNPNSRAVATLVTPTDDSSRSVDGPLARCSFTVAATVRTPVSVAIRPSTSAVAVLAPAACTAKKVRTPASSTCATLMGTSSSRWARRSSSRSRSPMRKITAPSATWVSSSRDLTLSSLISEMPSGPMATPSARNTTISGTNRLNRCPTRIATAPRVAMMSSE